MTQLTLACLQNSVGLYISGALYGYVLLVQQDKRQSEGQLNALLTKAQQELEERKSQVRLVLSGVIFHQTEAGSRVMDLFGCQHGRILMMDADWFMFWYQQPVTSCKSSASGV